MRLTLALTAAALLLLAPAASADESYDAAWRGGELLVTATDSHTQATIQKITQTGEDCGTNPEEASCTWELKAILNSDPATRCNPSTPDSQVVWSSGLQSGNGSISAGPVTFALEGCRGQTLSLSYEFHKTYTTPPGEESPPFRVIGGGSTWPVLTFGFHPLEEADRAVSTANPPASPLPPFAPNFTPWMPTVDSGCHLLTIGATRYAFLYKQIGCRKATNLAKMVQLSGANPSGYSCAEKAAGGMRCTREGHPRKYVEWRLPHHHPS